MGGLNDAVRSVRNSIGNTAFGLLDPLNIAQSGANTSAAFDQLKNAHSLNDASNAITSSFHKDWTDKMGNTGGAILDPAGALLNKGGDPSPPPTPGIDPAIGDQAAQQKKQADDFKASMPGLNNDIFNSVAKTERGNLAGQLSGIKSRDSSRGMLYSGMHQANDMGARVQSGSRLATAKASINTDLSNHLASMNDLAINSGMQLQQNQQDMNNSIYNQALFNMNQNLALGNSVGSAGGRMAGYAIGSMNNSPGAPSGGGGGLLSGQPTYSGNMDYTSNV